MKSPANRVLLNALDYRDFRNAHAVTKKERKNPKLPSRQTRIEQSPNLLHLIAGDGTGITASVRLGFDRVKLKWVP